MKSTSPYLFYSHLTFGKKTQTIAIVEDLKELRASNKLISERMPNIIQHTKQEKQKLLEQTKDNYVKKGEREQGLSRAIP
jgi:hypothetical protein